MNVTNHFYSSNSTANDIALDYAGNIFIVGWNGSLTSLTDAFIAKFDNNGKSLMNISHHFMSSNSSAEAITLDNWGNIYIAGYNGSLISSTDAFFAKYASPLPFILFLWLKPSSEEKIPSYPPYFTILVIFTMVIIAVFLFQRKRRIYWSND
jgi:hypothetical protein